MGFKLYKTPAEQAEELERQYPVFKMTHTANFQQPVVSSKLDKLAKLEFEKMQDEELLNHFIKSSGWGFTGSHKNGAFSFDGPEWDKAWNPMSRKQVIAELNDRRKIDTDEDGDYFDYLDEDEE